MVNITVLNATVLTLDKGRRVIEDGGIAIEGDKILDVGKSDEILAKYGEGDETIDASGMLAMPGMVNAHTHIFQDLIRGLGVDLDQMGWMDKVLYPVNNALTDEDIYVAALSGCVELIKTGTTFVIDNHHVKTDEGAIGNVVKGIEQTGIKGMIARGMKTLTKRAEKLGKTNYVSRFSLDEEVRLTEKMIQKWHGTSGGRVQVCPAPVAVWSTGPEMFKEAKRISDKYKVPIHTHIAEWKHRVDSALEDYGKREIELLHDTGILSPRFQSVHSNWLDDNEIKMLAETGANVVHCPVANTILASGIAKVPKMLRAGVNVALASDGSACGHNQDMISVLKITALLHKITNLDPLIIRAENVIEMATLGGAKALGLENEIGSLEAGKKADIVLIDLMKPHIEPVNRPVTALVYCAVGSDVDTTIIDGKVVMRGRKMLTVDEHEAMSKVEEVASGLLKRANIEHIKYRDWPK